MGLSLHDVGRNSVLALLVFGALLIGPGGVFLRRRRFARAGLVMIVAGILVALSGIALWIVR